jgi:hypothetical protein
MKKLCFASAYALGAMLGAANAQDATAAALAILEGFRSADPAQITPHLNASNTLRYAAPAQILDMSRADIAAQWDGTILPPRYERTTAFVPFAIDGPDGLVSVTSDADGVYIALNLSLDEASDTTWGLRSITRVMPQTYDARASEPY